MKETKKSYKYDEKIEVSDYVKLLAHRHGDRAFRKKSYFDKVVEATK